jgi:hypothetical protein
VLEHRKPQYEQNIMAAASEIRQYIVLSQIHPSSDHQNPTIEVERLLQILLLKHNGRQVAVPSDGWQFYQVDKPPAPVTPPEKVVSAVFPDKSAVDGFRIDVDNANQTAIGHGEPPPFVGVGADLSVSETEYFCPASIDQLLFGDRAAASRLMESRILREHGLTGQGVNIVVIDQGFDRTKVRNFGGGWAQGAIVPGMTTQGHGPMIVRNVFATAPDATFWDLPLIPLAIDNVNAFIATAVSAFQLVLQYIAGLPDPGPWVLVNAWAIFDRSSEYPIGDYTENPNNHFNLLIGQAVDQGIDVVFVAGNCGQFCPSRRCGRLGVGPGYSIWGANSHPRVLTTGAVQTDARWLGYSSQGPGQPRLSLSKPDLCAPSNFRDEHDAFTGNTAEPYVGNTGTPFVASTGTSAACGLAAGVVAALRSRWGPTTVTPDYLIQRLNATARKTEGPSWNGRLGNGILYARAAYDNLNALYPAGHYP